MMGFPAFKPEAPGAPPPDQSAIEAPVGRVLASLLVRKGPLKGERFAIRVPVANVGRAEYNDVVLSDASVSQAHAKLQRRDNVWVVVDLGSTNGTHVDKVQVEDETPLSPGSTIKFGEVPVLFDPTEGTMDLEDQPGTRVVAALGDLPPAPTPGPQAEAPDAPRRVPHIVASGSKKSGAGKWVITVVILAAVAAAAYYFLVMR